MDEEEDRMMRDIMSKREYGEKRVLYRTRRRDCKQAVADTSCK